MPEDRQARKQVVLSDRFSEPLEEFSVGDWPMHYLLAIAHMHVQNMEFVLARHDCPPTYWRVLSTLIRNDGLSVGHLADICAMRRSNLSRVIDAMERLGLVSRRGKDGDGRKRQVFLTEKGRALLRDSYPDVLTYYRRFLAGMDDEEIGGLVATLKKIKANVAAQRRAGDD